MKEAPAFDWVCAELERVTTLSGTEARGLVRLVLKDAGLEPLRVGKLQMEVVLKRMLPAALRRVRVTSAEALCERMAEEIRHADLPSPLLGDPEDVFGRLRLR